MPKPRSLLLIAAAFAVGAAFAQAPPKDAITQADRAAWFGILGWPADLEAFYRDTHLAETDGNGFMAFYPVATGSYLVEIVVTPGAYQLSYVYMLYDEATAEAELLELPWYSLGAADELIGGARTEVVGLPSFDEVTKELVIFTKWRGVGGCGTLQRYGFGGGAAALIETRAQTCETADEAGEAMILAPFRWPVIWPLGGDK